MEDHLATNLDHCQLVSRSLCTKLWVLLSTFASPFLQDSSPIQVWDLSFLLWRFFLVHFVVFEQKLLCFFFISISPGNENLFGYFSINCSRIFDAFILLELLTSPYWNICLISSRYFSIYVLPYNFPCPWWRAHDYSNISSSHGSEQRAKS